MTRRPGGRRQDGTEECASTGRWGPRRHPGEDDACRAASGHCPRADEDAYSERALLTRYLREAGEIPLLTPTATAELFRRIEEGEAGDRRAARASLITANLRLVAGVARHYVELRLSLPELISGGNLGLIGAVGRFERSRGHRFSTFARWPIRKAITRALDDRTRLVRLPVHIWQALRDLRKAKERLPGALGHEPPPVEPTAACKVATWRFDALRVTAATPVSIDAQTRSGHDAGAEETTLGETLEGRERPLPTLVGDHIARAARRVDRRPGAARAGAAGAAPRAGRRRASQPPTSQRGTGDLGRAGPATGGARSTSCAPLPWLPPCATRSGRCGFAGAGRSGGTPAAIARSWRPASNRRAP